MSNQNAPKNDQAAGGGFGSVFNDSGAAPVSTGDFQTNFGSENSAMSDIFKGSAPSQDERKKKIIMLAAAAAAFVVCGGAIFFLTSAPTEDEMAPSVAEPAVAANPAVTTPAVVEEDEAEGEEEGVDAVAGEETEDGAGAAMPAEVESASSYKYNEKAGGPVVRVKAGALVEVSLREDFNTLYVSGAATEGGFRIPNPPPGVVFWREQGSASINKITVSAPKQLGLQFSAPAKLASDAELSWSAAGEASFFRVEFAADPEFQNITNVFATAKTGMKIADVGAGKYHVRLAGFNTAAGRWEYSKPGSVEVN